MQSKESDLTNMNVEAILGEKMRWGTCVIISWLPRNGLKSKKTHAFFSKRTVDDFAAFIIDLLADHTIRSLIASRLVPDICMTNSESSVKGAFIWETLIFE